jgi:hemolysin III
MQQASNERMAREEFANALTHGAGAVLSAAGGAVLIVLAALRGDAWLVVGSAIFAAALLLLYTSSTLYHAARTTVLRRRFKVLDHCAIYVLIAGTYTPFMLGTRGGWGWGLFGVVWGLAAAGVVFKLFFTGRFNILSTIIYIAMGWLVLIGAGPLVRHLDTSTLFWLVAGGITYTAGTLFYHRPRMPFAHAVWHLFVLGGSLCHGIAVTTLIL